MATQLLIVDSKGGIAGLDHKRRGVDLRRLGQANVERITMIEFDSAMQMWYVTWWGRKENKVWGSEFLPYANFSHAWVLEVNQNTNQNRFLFRDYEHAVEFETTVVQALQKQNVAI